METEAIEKLWRDITESDVSAQGIITALLPSLHATLKSTQVKHAFGWLIMGGALDSAHLVCCGASGILNVVVRFRDKNGRDETAELTVQASIWADVAEVKQDFSVTEDPGKNYSKRATLRSATLRLRSGADGPIPLTPPVGKRGVGLWTADDGVTIDNREASRFVDGVVEILGSR